MSQGDVAKGVPIIDKKSPIDKCCSILSIDVEYCNRGSNASGNF